MDLVPLGAKLLEANKHDAFLACSKRARDLQDEAAALQAATQAKVSKLQHDARLESTKIAVNALPAQSPYAGVADDVKQVRARDEKTFKAQMTAFLNDALVRVKAGDEVWLGAGQEFYRKVTLVKFATTPGGDGGNAAYLDSDKAAPVEVEWEPVVGGAGVFNPKVGDIVDAQTPYGNWYESKILAIDHGEYTLNFGYPRDTTDVRTIPLGSRRIQPKNTITTGPWNGNSSPQTVNADFPGFKLPSASSVKGARPVILPVIYPPMIDETAMKRLLECYFLPTGITFLPVPAPKDDSDIDMCDGVDKLAVAAGQYLSER